MKKGIKEYKKPKKMKSDEFTKLSSNEKEEKRRYKVCFDYNSFVHYLTLIIGTRMQ